MKTMNEDKSLWESVDSIAYDDSGKYVALAGAGGITVTTVKEWESNCSIATKKPVSGVVWNKATLVASSGKERHVRFYGSA